MKRGIFLLLCCFCLSISQAALALQFHNSVETLNKIAAIIEKKEKGVYLRFGDGDILLALGDKDGYQAANSDLQQEMSEAFALSGPNVLKCLPLHCAEFGGFEEGMVPGKHLRSFEDCTKWLNMIRPKWNGDVDDVYSMTALSHAATDNLECCLQFLKFLKQSGCCLLVGNCDIPLYIRELLFGSQCQFVPTPSRNAYDEIDRIERECLEKVQHIDGYKIIVTSMGCSGRAFQKRLWNKLDNVFLFDFGSLMDAICGWNTRWWIEVSEFNSQDFLELLEEEFG